MFCKLLPIGIISFLLALKPKILICYLAHMWNLGDNFSSYFLLREADRLMCHEELRTFLPSSSMFEQGKRETKSTSEGMGLVELILVSTTVLWLLSPKRVSNYLNLLTWVHAVFSYGSNTEPGDKSWYAEDKVYRECAQERYEII